MTQLESQESGDRAIASKTEAKSLQTTDAQEARVAGADQVDAVHALNPNRHNGSAGGDRHHSIQIIALDDNGEQTIIAQRPQDMGRNPKAEITPDFIKDKAKTGDIYAQTFAKDLDRAEKLAPGPEKDRVISDTLWKAECMFAPGKGKEAPKTTGQIMDTGAFLRIEAEKNPVAEPVVKLHQWAQDQPPGPEQEAFKELVRQQAADLSPEMRAHMQELAQIRAESDQAGLETGGTHMAISPEMLQGKVSVTDEAPLSNTTEGWLKVGQKIAMLPLLQQVEIVGSGLAAGTERYLQEERQRAFGRLIGTVEGVGQVAVNLAKVADFGAALVLGDNERAGQMGAEFGTAVGETIVSGVGLFNAANEYFQSVGYSGNYDKPFADLLVVANTLNERWNQLPPLEQERIKYRFVTEMTADGLIGLGGAKAIGKAKTFTEVLDSAAQEVVKHGKQAVDASKKAAKTVANTIDDLLQPEFVTPDGQKIKLGRLDRPHADKPDTGMLMSKADDINGKSGRHRGIDASGKALRFSDDSGIELATARPGQDGLWKEVPVVRGNDVHVGLRENLPPGTKTIDRVVVKDGIAESIKSIDPRELSYATEKGFENKITHFVDDLENYKGRQTKSKRGLQWTEDQIEEKVLHIGIPDGAITPQQISVLENIGKQLIHYNQNLPFGKAPIKLKVTVLK